MQGCCPPNAEKYLAPDYKFVGQCHKLNDGLEYYATGNPKTKKAVLLINDLFGWNGGRTRNIADHLAENGFYTVVPKLMTPPVDGGTDGDGFAEMPEYPKLFELLKERFNFEANESKLNSITQFLKSQGIEKIHLLGFCWGGWIGCRLLATTAGQQYASMVAAHPSVFVETLVYGRNMQDVFDKVQTPLFLMPAKGDPDEFRAGGACYESVKARYPSSRTMDFPEQNHGFIPRVDLNVPENREAVEKAMNAMVEFFNAH